MKIKYGRNEVHDFSFAKAERLRKRSEYVELSKNGKKIYSKHFIAIFQASSSEETRLGITVTKKVGCASKRNRIKRIIREFFRQNKEDFTGNWDINIIAKKEASAISTDKAFSSLQWIFNNIARKAYLESGH